MTITVAGVSGEVLLREYEIFFSTLVKVLMGVEESSRKLKSLIEYGNSNGEDVNTDEDEVCDEEDTGVINILLLIKFAGDARGS